MSWERITQALARHKRGLLDDGELIAWGQRNADWLLALNVRPIRSGYNVREGFVQELRIALTRPDINRLGGAGVAQDAAIWEYSRQRTGWHERLASATHGRFDHGCPCSDLDALDHLYSIGRYGRQEWPDSFTQDAAHQARLHALAKHWGGKIPPAAIVTWCSGGAGKVRWMAGLKQGERRARRIAPPGVSLGFVVVLGPDASIDFEVIS